MFFRYKAICYPLRHRPSAWQYILFVLAVSLLQNIPKFFEFKVSLHPKLLFLWKLKKSFLCKESYMFYNKVKEDPICLFLFHAQLVHNNTEYWTTSLSENEDYVRFRGWWDELVVTGMAPFIALVYFNVRIYRKIRYEYKIIKYYSLEKIRRLTQIQ